VLDPKQIRNEPELVRQGIIAKNENVAVLDEFLEVDERRRALLAEVELLKAERNRESEEIARLKREKQDASEMIIRMRGVSDKIKEMDVQVRELDERLEYLLLRMPNMPDGGTPTGKDETDNAEIKRVGTPREFDFEPLPHWELAKTLDIIDFDRGSKISGSGFILYKGLGARLERALFNWMVDLHVTKHGYVEVFPPYLVNRRSMMGTGQIPKLEEDMYRDTEVELFLIRQPRCPLLTSTWTKFWMHRSFQYIIPPILLVSERRQGRPAKILVGFYVFTSSTRSRWSNGLCRRNRGTSTRVFFRMLKKFSSFWTFPIGS
jgi:seryl-tRNA synthetase